MNEESTVRVKVGGRHAVDSILESLGLLNHPYIDKDVITDLLFYQKEEREVGTKFFSHLKKESLEKTIAHEKFTQIYTKFSLARKKKDTKLMEEAIQEYKGLSALPTEPVSPGQRNP